MHEEKLEKILTKLNTLEGQLQEVYSNVEVVKQEVSKLTDKWKGYSMDDVVSRLKHVNITLNNIETALDDVALD
ncbi:hypothetical protein D770_12185 [Flammeovirgaceae bacterium 311]|nr:hypothetical protein D770_12185 [Flammeovirgaceae bacterium 311]